MKATPDAWVFPQKTAPKKPMWDSTVREALHEAARIAVHRDLEMTSLYTFVAAERQNELTRRIQRRLAEAGKREFGDQAENMTEVPPAMPPTMPSPPTPSAPPSFCQSVPLTDRIQ